ncbi:MAG: sulfite exporter TauE/SafE family protein, partial [Oscillospiraceae bacterium]|nr:sulfite exporter TauE/SafE family protein [Oscillospiraceae bacterium]
CLLPMIPVYVSYFAGGEERTGSAFKNSLGFVAGFTTMFILMGALAGTIGSFLVRYRTAVNVVTGLIVIIFGLSFLGVFRLPFFGRSGKSVQGGRMRFASAVLFGVVFSTGWTPCVGAFLGSALMMASREGSVLKGILMLFLYSLGLGIPFILSAVLIDKLKAAFDFIKRNYGIINKISGGILVLVGTMMVTGIFDKLLAVIG